VVFVLYIVKSLQYLFITPVLFIHL